MELNSTHLINHQYSQRYLECKCPIVKMKDANQKWNSEEHSNHRFKVDIEQSDIVFSIKDSVTGNEEYAFFFFKTDVASGGNVMYTLTNVVLDENLPEGFIRSKVNEMVNMLNDGESLRIDRIVASGNYPLVYYMLKDTSDKVANDIIAKFLSIKSGGPTPIPPIMENKLKSIAEKENSSELTPGPTTSA